MTPARIIERRNQKGAISLIVVLALLAAVIGILALTIDMNKNQSAYTNNQGSVDSATLSAAEWIMGYRLKNGSESISSINLSYPGANCGEQASSGSNAEMAIFCYALELYKTNLATDQSYATLTKFEMTLNQDTGSEEGRYFLNVHACVDVANNFAKGGSPSVTNVCNEAKALIPSLAYTEVVFAVDASASMLDTYTVNGVTGTKVSFMRNGIKNVINHYANQYGSNGKITTVTWGLVPFKGMVDLGNNSVNIVMSLMAANSESETGPGVNGGSYHARMVGDSANLWAKAGLLSRIPLTHRLSDDINNEPSWEADDLRRAPNSRPNSLFRPYHQHPYDYWFVRQNAEACGACGSSTGYTRVPEEKSSCISENDMPNSGCGGSGGGRDSSGGGGPGSGGAGGGNAGGAR